MKPYYAQDIEGGAGHLGDGDGGTLDESPFASARSAASRKGPTEGDNANEAEEELVVAADLTDNDARYYYAVGHDASRVQTSAETLREQKLRDDNMAIVYNPRLVQCQRCGAMIKLSLKSLFDTFHWRKHRTRCLKRPDEVVQAMKLANEKANISSLATATKSAQRRHRKLRMPSPPPLTPSSAADDSSCSDASPSSPETTSQALFTETGQVVSRDASTHTGMPVSIKGYTGSAIDLQARPRRWYPGLVARHDVYNHNAEDDWCFETYRTITFQESNVRFTQL